VEHRHPVFFREPDEGYPDGVQRGQPALDTREGDTPDGRLVEGLELGLAQEERACAATRAPARRNGRLGRARQWATGTPGHPRPIPGPGDDGQVRCAAGLTLSCVHATSAVRSVTVTGATGYGCFARVSALVRSPARVVGDGHAGGTSGLSCRRHQAVRCRWDHCAPGTNGTWSSSAERCFARSPRRS
jgi:hypothetical protein